jgi:biopolymer transport protein TolR
MSMTEGNLDGMNSTINITPMIDVLLVLLIIFMVIVPSMPRGESALIPRSSRGAPSVSDAVVLEVLKSSSGNVNFKINQQDVARQDLATRLSAIFANRSERVLFVKGDDQLAFTQIAEVIDIGHAAGADRVGLMTPKILATQ